MFNSQ
jgi:HrpA-like RNA helicase